MLPVIVVEDDHLQADWIAKSIRDAFPFADVSRVSTEHEFRSRLNEFQRDPPAIFIIDSMLRWTNPSPEMEEPPDEVRNDGFYRAGLRCVSQLSKNESTRPIPIILYTVLENIDLGTELSQLPQNVTYIRKMAESSSLVSEIGRVLKISQHRLQ